MTNLPAAHSTLDRQISALTEKLAPVHQDHISEAVASMLKAGMSLPSNMDPSEAPAVYGFAMNGASVGGVKRAVVKLIRGEYDLRNRSFIPSPPELAALARDETRIFVADRARLRETMQSLTERPEPRSPEMTARAKELVAHWRASEEARKAETALPHQPMTEDRADYWRRIMDVKDAPNPGDEQMQFRRQIEKQVADTNAADMARGRVAA